MTIETVDWQSTIQAVAVHLAGDIECRVDVSNAGTKDAQACVYVGSVLVRVQRRAARRLAEAWRDAALHTNRLPKLSKLYTGHEVQCPASLVVRIGPDAALAQQLIPTAAIPGHIRVQTGPVAWLVMDQAAYDSVRKAWSRAAKVV